MIFIDLGRKTSWIHGRGCKPITLIFGLVYIFLIISELTASAVPI